MLWKTAPLLFWLFALPQTATAAAVALSDQTQAAGLSFAHDQPLDHRSGPMVAGAAVGDFNGDGFPDLFVIGGGDVADGLFINNRDGTFSDKADTWGVDIPHRGVAATVGDYDGDGDDDIYVTSLGPMSQFDGPGHHLLYRNEGREYFVNVAGAAGVATTSATYPDGYGAAFGDYDRDGDLDLFVGGWHSFPALGARLFRNEGDGRFVDVTENAGVITGGTHAFGAVWADMDGDRYPELLVAGDFGTSRYYRNNRDGSFLELDPGTGLRITPGSTEWSIGKAHNAMGTTVADFDRDGRLDWFVTAIWPTFAFASEFWGNGLYLNQGDHVYTEEAHGAGVHDGGWGWGTAAADMDNDGWTDLMMTNGWPVFDGVTGETFSGERSYLWRNQGDLTFAEVLDTPGLAHTGQGRSLLHLDYDRDGDIDILITSNQEPLQLFRNDLIAGATPADGHWLQVELKTGGNDGLAPHGVGALITLEAGGVSRTQQITTGGTYLGQSELIAHFGLGASKRIERVIVDWGNGKFTRLRGVRADQRIVLRPDCRPRSNCPGRVAD